jgi:hypothetical protein
MPDNTRTVTLTSAVGFRALIKYEMSGDFWIKDIEADQWYFGSFNEGNDFRRLIDGEACRELRKGERVNDKGLLLKLRQAKFQHIETYVAADPK